MCSENCGCSGECAPSIDVIPGPQGPVGNTPTIAIGTVTTLAAGSQATVTNTGSAVAAVFNFGVVTGATGATGAAGTAATNLYTSLTNAFTIPALNSSTIATVGNTSWMRVGMWVRMTNGSSSAAYLYITGVPSSTTVQFANMGSVNGWPTGVALQPAPSTVISPDSTLLQIQAAAAPGLPGATGATGGDGPTGDPGVNSLVPFVNAIPSVSPVPGQETQIYQNDVSAPTIMRFYYWNGSIWTASGNFVGAAGTQVVTTPGDPNVTLPAVPIGSLAFNSVTPTLYLKTGASTWVLQFSIAPTFQQVATTSSGNFGTVPTSTQRVIGYVTLADTHTIAGAYTFDTAYQSILVEADVDMELDYDASTYTQSAEWTWQVENVDGSPIALTYAASRFDKKTGLSLPSTLAAGAIQVYQLKRSKAKLLITDTYVSVAV